MVGKFWVWLLPIVVLFGSLMIGRYWISPEMVMGVLVNQVGEYAGWSYFGLSQDGEQLSRQEEIVVVNLRLPRILMGLLIGAGLAAGGVSFQAMFGNPLVSPQILGVASGAGVGGVLALVLGMPEWLVMGMAFGGGLGAMALAMGFAGGANGEGIRLVLAGVIVGTLGGALISVVKLMADPNDQLPTIVWWLMGSLSRSSWDKLIMVGPILMAGMGWLYLMRWRLNLLSLGDEEARSLGVDMGRLRLGVVIVVSLMVAVSVAVAGIVGWIGLVVPHMGRMIVGSDHKRLLGVVISLGGSYLVVMDTLARSVSNQELPVGVLTALVGAGVFGWLLRQKSGGWYGN